MADNFIAATVSPDLPLSPLLLEVLGACDNDLEDTLGEFWDGCTRITRDTLRRVVRDTRSDLSAEALDLLVDFLVGHATGPDGRVCFESVPLDYAANRAGSYYLYAEDGFCDACLNWLTWAIHHLPESVQEIEVEWSSWCSKPRRGEFSGGCALITRDGCSTMTTSDMLRMMRDKAVAEGDPDDAGTVEAAPPATRNATPAHNPEGLRPKGVVTLGDHGVGTVGDGGAITVGDCGRALAGRGGSAEAGMFGITFVDGMGRATVGRGGLAIAEAVSRMAAGEGGVLVGCWYPPDVETRRRIAVGYIGETLDASGAPLEPDVSYTLNDAGAFVRKE